MAKSNIAFYGNTALWRATCSFCGGKAFVKNGLTLCCGAKVDDPSGHQQMSEPPIRRKIPRGKEQKDILERQGSRCFYCFRPFGSLYEDRKGSVHVLRLNWDHLIPYSWRRDNRGSNFVAACHRCNSWKGAKLYKDIAQARSYLNLRWKQLSSKNVEKYAPDHSFFSVTGDEENKD